MAVTYGFFDSRSGDRKYNAQQMTEFYDGIVTEGVFQHKDGGLAVTAGTGLSVSVASGRAIVQNRWLKNDAAMTLQISAASETYARKDAVVIRLDTSARTISILVKTGTPAASPTAPSMTRSGSTYEMALAYVNVAAGATSVTVTDKRSDSAVCGWAAVAQAASGEVDAMLNDMKTGFDGVVYQSPGDAVRSCDQKLQDQIDPLYGYGDTEVSSTLNGYYNSDTFTASETRYTLVYDVTDIDKVQVSGTFLAYNNIYTLLNSSDTVIHYLTNTTSDYEYSGVIDVSDSAKLCVSAHANTIDSISVKFYQPAYIDSVKKVDAKVDSLEDHLIALLPLDINHVEGGYYSNATKNTSSTWKSNYYDLSNVNFVKLVCNTTQYINEYTFLDGNGTPVKYKQATASSQTNEYEFDCSAYSTLVMAEKDECVSYVFAYQNSAKHIPVRNDSNWVGKKIVWFGTSIPAGGYLGLLDPQSYPNILGKMLGCNMFNEAVGSSTVHCKINGFITEQNPYGYMPNFQSSSRCLSNDLTDMEYIITNYNSGIFTSQVPETMTGALAEQIMDCSWERKLNKYLGIGNRADLYVFDVGYNDIRTLESQYDPSDPTDRHTFTGAMNFLLEKIFADNPRAKVVMMGHYENQTENGVSVTNLQKTYAGMWLIDLYPLWEKTGFSQQIIKTTGYWNNSWGLWIDTSATEQSITALNMWLRDGVHPHSDFTHRTERYIAELIYPWINNIKGYDTRRNVKVEYPDPVTT